MKSYFLGEQSGQSIAEMYIWETLDFERIIEIGTWKGGFSLYLYLLCLNKGKDFYTYDIYDYEDSKLKKLLNFKKCFKRKNVFSGDVEKEIKELIQRKGKTILFCDGGNKKREFEMYSKHMKKGDLIAIHDWQVEVFELKTDLEELFIIDTVKFYKK